MRLTYNSGHLLPSLFFHFCKCIYSIVVTGPEAFAEDKWESISIGSLPLRVVKPCSRCKIPNINQDTAEVKEDPGQTLKTFRWVSLASCILPLKYTYISKEHN